MAKKIKQHSVATADDVKSAAYSFLNAKTTFLQYPLSSEAESWVNGYNQNQTNADPKKSSTIKGTSTLFSLLTSELASYAVNLETPNELIKSFSGKISSEQFDALDVLETYYTYHASCTSGCAGNCYATCHASGCSNSCSTICSMLCTGTCDESCKGSCAKSCSGGCSTDCKGTCITNSCSTSACADSCSSYCVSGCSHLCTSCSGSVAWACTKNCGKVCDGGEGAGRCKGDCSGYCLGSCNSSCHNTCSSQCDSNCANDCYSTCQGKCNAECSGLCSENCASTCYQTCTSKCTVTCTDDCISNCSFEHGFTAFENTTSEGVVYRKGYIKPLILTSENSYEVPYYSHFSGVGYPYTIVSNTYSTGSVQEILNSEMGFPYVIKNLKLFVGNNISEILNYLSSAYTFHDVNFTRPDTSSMAGRAVRGTYVTHPNMEISILGNDNSQTEGTSQKYTRFSTIMNTTEKRNNYEEAFWGTYNGDFSSKRGFLSIYDTSSAPLIAVSRFFGTGAQSFYDDFDDHTAYKPRIGKTLDGLDWLYNGTPVTDSSVVTDFSLLKSPHTITYKGTTYNILNYINMAQFGVDGNEFNLGILEFTGTETGVTSTTITGDCITANLYLKSNKIFGSSAENNSTAYKAMCNLEK